MPKLSVYVPDDLDRDIKEAGIQVSQVCQKALEQAVKAARSQKAVTDQDLLRAAADRLRGEAEREADERRANGYAEGRDFTLRWATPEDLMHIRESVQDGFREIRFENEYENDEGQPLRLYRGDSWSEGFIKGAMDAWRQVRDFAG